MMHDTEEARVKAANRVLYDAIARNYEEVDGRRSVPLVHWLTGRIEQLAGKSGGRRLLDLGAGNGFVSRCAKGVFEERVALDISPRILGESKAAFEMGVVGDGDFLPFASNSFDAIVCFAALHHMYGFELLVPEIVRVLRPGGVFFSDHDMDKAFHNRFAVPLKVYRTLRNARGKYVKAHEDVTESVYAYAEWHEDGIDSEQIAGLFTGCHCEVVLERHWYGLTPVTDLLFGTERFGCGWAPLVSILARKVG